MLFSFIFSLLLSSAQAKINLTPCSKNPTQGMLCQGTVDQLKPTQSAVGLIEVNATAKDLKKMSKDEFQAELIKKEIPVVIAPDFSIYLVDHHHFARAIYDIGKNKVALRIRYNWSECSGGQKMSTCMAAFWNKMGAQDPRNTRQAHSTPVSELLVYLIDRNDSPFTVGQLPPNIQSMVDDPYRSVTGKLEDKSEILKPENFYYFEFVWARYVEKQFKQMANLADPEAYIAAHFKDAVKLAAQVVHAPAASQMPGYTPTRP